MRVSERERAGNVRAGLRRFTSPPSAPLELDPEVVARARVLLRQLERATTEFIDALDVAGFPAKERESELALLANLASGLPAVTLADLVEALRLLSIKSGPQALFPETAAQLSLPDEARELLYLVEPLTLVAQARNRLPRYAGVRLGAVALTFSLTQAKSATALNAIASALRQLMALPLRQPQLTTLRESVLRGSPFAQPRSRAANITAADVPTNPGTIMTVPLSRRARKQQQRQQRQMQREQVQQRSVVWDQPRATRSPSVPVISPASSTAYAQMQQARAHPKEPIGGEAAILLGTLVLVIAVIALVVMAATQTPLPFDIGTFSR